MLALGGLIEGQKLMCRFSIFLRGNCMEGVLGAHWVRMFVFLQYLSDIYG